MSGYVPKRVANTRTAMGTTDQRPADSGSVMLTPISTIGRRSNLRSQLKRRAISSFVQKDCKQGTLNKTTCDNIASSLADTNNNVNKQKNLK